MQHPTGRVPERVALIAAGPSKTEWVDLMAAAAIEGPLVDEVWGINAVGRGVRVDLTFMMDDYAAFKGHNPSLTSWYETAPHPIITSQARKECPSAVAYPLADVLALPAARDYFNHTVPYAIAYAVALGVKELLIFGADYISNASPYVTGYERTGGAARYIACTSYWIGYASASGMDVIACPSGPLLDADVPQGQKFYGYLVKPVVRRNLSTTPVEQIERKKAS